MLSYARVEQKNRPASLSRQLQSVSTP